MKITDSLIAEIFQLAHAEQWSLRKIARHLGMDRQTVRKYVRTPCRSPVMRRARQSKLDAFKGQILELLERDPTASTEVIRQRLAEQGYAGGRSILRAYLRQVRPKPRARAYLRIESPPGECLQVDWGYFGVLDYQGEKRKVYGFCAVEAHSRLLFVEFYHSQQFESFTQAILNACRYLKGVPRTLLFDNLASAVSERDGPLVRFNPRFLAFAQQLGFMPKACHVRSPWEKGKTEKSVHYTKINFWPLRTFTDLGDLNRQARDWLERYANQRLHGETREKPAARFQQEALLPLPGLLPDCREMATPRVHKDCRVLFDGNRYAVPPRLLGHTLVLRADGATVTLYENDSRIISHPRCWRRAQTIGAELYRQQLAEYRPAAQLSVGQQQLVACLGELAEAFLRGLALSNRPLARQVQELVTLVRLFPLESVRQAMEKALAARAFGADYVAYLLHAQQQHRPVEPPLCSVDPALQALQPDPLSLVEYDALLFDARRSL